MSYSFVLTNAVLEDECSHDIAPGHVLAKATDEQIAEIKYFLGRSFDYSHGFPWEYAPVKTDNGYSFPTGPREQWRYRVVNFEGPNEHIEELEWAMQLCKDDLEIGPTLISIGGKPHGIMHNPLLLSSFHAARSMMLGVPKSISTASIKEIPSYYQLIKTTLVSYPAFQRVFREFASLKALPRKSRFLTLGYFILLESVVTHQPSSSDSGDSLNRQIKSKMALLENRFCRKLDWTGFDACKSNDQLWSKLYAYRSHLAHGVAIDFKKAHKALKDDEAVRAFMQEAVKLVLIQVLKEPQLLLDLQQC
jgi:hypothetical protein